jgi:predicted transcriptional regulator
MVRVAERLRILGQPVRLRLVELLTEGASTPQELSDALGLSQQNVSKHLLGLHRAGLISRSPEGPNVVYGDIRRLPVERGAEEGATR